MQYFLDCLNPPTDAQASLIYRLGWHGFNVYVGGPYLSGHTPWSNSRVAALAAHGFQFLPLYVGQQSTAGMQGTLTYDQGKIDGAEATVLTGACGFNETTILGLDLEGGNPIDAAREYVRGWVEVVNGAGHPAVLYCDATTAHYLGTPDLIDYVWVADWVVHNLRRAPVGRFDPATDPPWSVWQFGGGTVAGVAVDYNSATDDFPLADYSV
jgi:hypothetical protein